MNSCYNCKYKKQEGAQWDYYYQCQHPSHNKFTIGNSESDLIGSVCNDHSPNASSVNDQIKYNCGFRKIK
ncbi:MAG: hypothetical protein ACRCX2_11290 [Paraclostridium sp.]